MQTSLNDITPGQLEEIKKLAALYFTPRDIAIIQEFSISEFVDACQEDGSPVHLAFNAGRLISETELRTSILKLAKSGSSPAQTMAMDMLNNLKMKMREK